MALCSDSLFKQLSFVIYKFSIIEKSFNVGLGDSSFKRLKQLNVNALVGYIRFVMVIRFSLCFLKRPNGTSAFNVI